jgi:hypothetical protein
MNPVYGEQALAAKKRTWVHTCPLLRLFCSCCFGHNPGTTVSNRPPGTGQYLAMLLITSQ